jgi:hypothetical protein
LDEAGCDRYILDVERISEVFCDFGITVPPCDSYPPWST